MTNLFEQPWFGSAIAVVLGLPIALIVLGEVHAWLVRRGSTFARPVVILRNVIVPLIALLILLVQTSGISDEATGVKVTWTALGLMVLLVVLSTLNIVLFNNAEQGSWRRRFPSIFVDIARVIIVVIGLGILFSVVWGMDVGGLFTALGVTSIVIGLALQNAVGSIVSGLLLLFEQPFQLGDWLDAGGVRGRVKEVNWRAVHIETTNGVQIVPNATLAGSSFTNLSEPNLEYVEPVDVSFAASDPPDRVRAVLEKVAYDLGVLATSASAVTVVVAGDGKYTVNLRLPDIGQAGEAESRYLSWLWYAARRAGLHLDGDDTPGTRLSVEEAVKDAAPTLLLEDEQIAEVAAAATVEVFGDGERVQRSGVVPDSMSVIVSGAVAVRMPGDLNGVPVETFEAGSVVDATSLTREETGADGYAVGEVTVVVLPVKVVRKLVQQRPELARQVGQEIERRQSIVREKLVELEAV